MSQVTKRDVIDFLVQRMDAEEILGCLEEPNIADTFYTVNQIEGRMFDYLQGEEDYICQALYYENEDNQRSLILTMEDEEDRRRISGWPPSK